MSYIHQEFNLSSGQAIEVTLDKQANVLLLDATNYSHYRRRQQFRYYGGLVKVSPYRIAAPHAGHWHLVIDRGGLGGTVRAATRLV